MVNNIDKIAPAKPTASADITTETSGNVTVTAVFSGDSAKKEFSLAGLVWQDYTAPLVFTENGRAYFRGTDAAGNASDIISYEVRNIQAATPDNALDDGRNDKLYDKKTKEWASEENIASFVVNDIAAGDSEILLDKDGSVDDGKGRHNFVGRAGGDEDAADYAKIELSKGAALSFSIDSTVAGTFYVYQATTDKKGNDTLEAIQTTKLKLDKGASVVDKFTDAISGLAAGEYYISMTATNTSNNAKGSVFYNVTATFEPSDMASLAMPETSDSLAMTDSLSFGTFDTDVIASATSSSLAELDDKSAWQNLSLA